MIYQLKIIDIDNDTHEATIKKEFTFPFQENEVLYFVARKRKRYVVYKGMVSSFWFHSRMCGVKLVDYHKCCTHIYTEKEFNLIFKDRDAAVEYCAKQNMRLDVEVYE